MCQSIISPAFQKIMFRNSLSAIFFDLDGTLLDTAPDLVDALNQLLIKYGESPLPLEIIRPTIALGTTGILSNGFQIDATHPCFSELRKEFLTTYHHCMMNKTTYFDGMSEVLDYLDHHHITWGIVTNKPGWLAKPLLDHFQLAHRYCCLVSGDQLTKRKPDPEPLLYACKTANVLPQQALYVGDAQGDVQAAKAAGMMAMIALYGYLPADSQPLCWEGDALINSPHQLIDWIKTL